MTTRVKLVSALVIVVAVIGLLIRTAILHSTTYYVTVSELFQEGSKAINQPTTVSGKIVGQSVNWNPTSETLHFSVVDTTDASKSLPVSFKGPKPDDFTNNWPIIVTGNLSRTGVFTASKLLVKCPSKYQASNSTTRVYTSS